MPAPAPRSSPKLKKILRHLGGQIRARRKNLKVSAVATAEAAGISRVTLNRIERGEASVTLGAYLNVVSVLGLTLELSDANLSRASRQSAFELPEKIRLSDYPQLKRLAWQLKGATEISPQEALNLYERNWRHVNLNEMNVKERSLIQGLIAVLGKGRILV